MQPINWTHVVEERRRVVGIVERTCADAAPLVAIRAAEAPLVATRATEAPLVAARVADPPSMAVCAASLGNESSHTY